MQSARPLTSGRSATADRDHLIRSGCLGLLLAVLACAPPGALGPGEVDCSHDLAWTQVVARHGWSFRYYRGSPKGWYALVDEADSTRTPEACADLLERFLALWNDGHSSLLYYPGVQRTAPPIALRSRYPRDARPLGNEVESPRVYVVARDTLYGGLGTVEPGSEVVAVDSVPIDRHYARVLDRVSGSTRQWREYLCDQRLLAGLAGTDVELTLRQRDGTTKKVQVTRPPHPGEEEAKQRILELSHDPAGIALSERLPGGWGYIRLSTFAAESVAIVVEAFDRALDSLMEAPGLVIDLRHNGGGYLDAMTEIAGRFLAEETTFGYYQRRAPGEAVDFRPWNPSTVTDTMRTPITVKPRGSVYRGPVALIIDRGCFSACEGFSGGLKTLGRALVLGEASGGGGGVAALIELPSGALLSFSWSVFWLPDGEMIEGRGILPNVYVRNRARDWVAGRDRVLERAIEALGTEDSDRDSRYR